MQLWTYWLEALQGALQLLATTFGISVGGAIVLLTLALRLALLPVSWSSAYRGCIHQKKLRKLQPELRRLRDRFGKEPPVLAEKTLELYRRRGVSFVEWRPFLGSLVQMPVFLGMFHLLRSGAQTGRFLWVASLSRPDFWMAVVAAVTTAMMIAANPDLPAQMRIVMVALPAVIAFLFALKLASALSVYWVASNAFTAFHTIVVHYVVGRRIRNGRIAI